MPALLMRDGAEADFNQVDAHVKQGDYFVTLATQLNLLAEELVDNDEANSIELGPIIEELVYLQKTYAIIKKPTRTTNS